MPKEPNLLKQKLIIRKKCRLCADRDEKVNHIISECRKHTQKEYKSKHDGVGKVNHRELHKRLKFDFADKSYMHPTEFAVENEMH